MKFPIVGPSYQMDDRKFDHQRSINLYPLISEVSDSKDVVALKLCPGTSIYRTVGGGPIRGSITTSRGRSVIVSGREVYEITLTGETLLGTIGTATNRVSIADNGNEVMIVDGAEGYIFRQSDNTFGIVTDENFPAASIVLELDGYFVVNKLNSAAFYISALYDGTSWDALDFAVVSSIGGNIIGMIIHKEDLWLWSNSKAIVYTNTGNAGFPFEKIEGSSIPTGCEALFTIVEIDNAIVWLGIDKQGRGVVWRTQGYNAVRVSTQAIEKRIAQSVLRGESFAWVYHQQGHAFYMLQVKGLDTTLVLDVAVNQWHERSFKNASLNKREQHRGSTHFVFDNKNLVGDRENGNIYDLSLDYADDFGQVLVYERITAHIDAEKQNIKHNKFELDCMVGFGGNISLRYSDDGGFTWSAWLTISLGDVGHYKTRAEWRRLGMANDRVYHLRGHGVAKFQINEAFINGA